MRELLLLLLSLVWTACATNETIAGPEWVPIQGSFQYEGPVAWIPFSGKNLSASVDFELDTSLDPFEKLYRKMTRYNYHESAQYGYGGRPLLRHPTINYTESNVVDSRTDGYRMTVTRHTATDGKQYGRITAEWAIVSDMFIAIYMFHGMPFGQLYWPMYIQPEDMEVFVIHLYDQSLLDPSSSRQPHSITYLATKHRPYPYSIQTFLDDSSGGRPYDASSADHFLVDHIDGVGADDCGHHWTYRIDHVNHRVAFS